MVDVVAGELRVLVVEEDSGSESIRKQASGASGMTVAATAGFGPEAITTAQESRPEVVVVALEEPIARALRTIEILSITVPEAGIIVVAPNGDQETIRKALRAGARDYLVRPVRREDIRQAVRAVAEAEQKRRMLGAPDQRDKLRTGDIFAVVGAKGGVGKTTVSVNLATAISFATRQKVGLIDLDVQMGDVALMLSITPDRSIADAADNLDRLESDYLKNLLYTAPTGIRVLPAPLSVEASTSITGPQVEQVLDSFIRNFDYVVADTAPVLNDINLSAMDKATLTFVITSPDVASLKRTKILLNLLRTTWNYPEERLKLILNHPASHENVTVSEVPTVLNYPVFWSIPYDPEVPHAMKVGRPCVEILPKSRYTQVMTELAATICGVSLPKRKWPFGI